MIVPSIILVLSMTACAACLVSVVSSHTLWDRFKYAILAVVDIGVMIVAIVRLMVG